MGAQWAGSAYRPRDRPPGRFSTAWDRSTDNKYPHI